MWSQNITLYLSLWKKYNGIPRSLPFWTGNFLGTRAPFEEFHKFHNGKKPDRNLYRNKQQIIRK